MEWKIKDEIENISMRIEWKHEELDKAVKEFREAAAKYDDYNIATFIPRMIEEIARCREDMAKLAGQKKMLEYLLN